MKKKIWYSRMTADELDAVAATVVAATVDKEYDLMDGAPLTPAQRREEARARRKKPGRPPVGLGASKLRISMEKGLLKQVDSYAKEHGLTRSQLIAQSLRQLLGAA